MAEVDHTLEAVAVRRGDWAARNVDEALTGVEMIHSKAGVVEGPAEDKSFHTQVVVAAAVDMGWDMAVDEELEVARRLDTGSLAEGRTAE